MNAKSLTSLFKMRC